ncbi:MAG: glycosyltransferase family 9 protein [Bacteroidales bacterium]
MVKFLVIRFSSIGDIVLTSPVVRGLHRQVDHSEVHFLTKPAYAELLRANPHISKIHVLSENHGETFAALKKEGFDYVIDLQNNIRSLLVKRSLKKMYFTVHKLNFKKWLLVNLHINRLPHKHIVDRYLKTVELFDVENDGDGLDYFIPEEKQVHLHTLPEAFQQGYIALGIGAKHNTKRLPPDRWSELAGMLQKPVVILGGPEDMANGEEIKKSLPEKTILNGCGKWSIHQSASIIQQANGIITHDTGMMHIAAAFKKKIITIWGNTVPRFGMYAYEPGAGSIDFEVNGLRCRPCSKLGKKRCPKKHFKCMMEQDTVTIAAAANRLFSLTVPQTDR